MVPAGVGLLRASARWSSANGQDQVNVWWIVYDFASNQDNGDVFDGVDTYLQTCYTAFMQDVRNVWTPLDLKVDVVEFLGNKWVTVLNVGFGSWGAGLHPSASGDALPEGVSALGFLYTGLGKHTGRKFFGGFTEAAGDAGGNLVAATQARIVTGLTALLTPHIISAGNELALAVADMKTGFWRLVVEVASNHIFGYQRRRRPGVGS